ncbi:MAG: aminotransferase class I/II-fold pyridoxal phosphate-dependent enzyme [Actinomycetes bacterium]
MSVVSPGPHGGDGRLVAAALGLDPEDLLDLSLSLNPFAPDPTPIVRRHLGAAVIGRYPDRIDLDAATAELAAVLEVDEERVLLTNGGAEAIALVATELGWGWVEEPDFSLYLRHIAVRDHTGPSFRSDPHNPTGRLARESERAAVWDEAFYPLASGRWGAPNRGSSIVLGSLTKLLACPGLRIGYVVIPDDDGASLGVAGLRERLARRQPAWSVGALALAVIPELLATVELARWARDIAQARSELVGVLEVHGLAPLRSDANFVLVPGVPGLRDVLAREGVVVRDCASFGLVDHVRIAVPGPERLGRLDDALARSAAVIGDARRVSG